MNSLSEFLEVFESGGIGNNLVEEDTAHLIRPCVTPPVPELIQ